MRGTPLLLALALLGCTAAPARPTIPAGLYPTDRQVPLVADAEGYPISPTLGAFTSDGGWGSARPPVVLHHLANPDRHRAALMVDTTRGVTVFWVLYAADGSVLEWAGDPTVLRPAMPAAGRRPRGIEAAGP